MYMEMADDRHKDVWINDVRIKRPHRLVSQQLKLLLTPPLMIKQSGSAISGAVLI